ncbi:EAL domain-containing protein [Aliidiomarina haloalkalitolerans]|uniref:Bifunctional diguanylate cyclase/phosphodiesterase n=1 Tax=Aliidiomarina haloalkalitolerans TaxID=859059 RepID=A0A432VVK1_9GAMM|nr:EAL domain-containing protein [Aliidiomarina haloalkalitolerans]RUO20575.1 hypothetical protein CWE06_04490 [Aliidiomarina haloalkalitolerans]
MRRQLIISSTPAVAAFYTMVFAAIFTGAVGLGLYIFRPVEQPLLEVLSATAALVSIATGFAMFGAIRGYHIMRVAFATAIVVASLYSLARGAFFPTSATLPLELFSASIKWPITIFFMLIGAALLFNMSARYRQIIWRYLGALSTIAGLVFLGLCWQEDNFTYFGSHPIVVTISALYLAMFGVALFIGSYLENVAKLRPSRKALIVGGFSIVTVCGFWFMLTTSEVQRTAQQAQTYLAQTVALRELVVAQNVQLMQRLVRRWQTVNEAELPLLMEVDVLSYLNDVDHLSGILFLDTEGEFSWEELKPEQQSFAPLLATADVRAWLASTERQPSFHSPVASYNTDYQPVILVKLPIFRRPANGDDVGNHRVALFGYVVAVFDFSRLVNPTGVSATSALFTYVRMNEHYLLRSLGTSTEILDTREQYPQALYTVARNMRMPFGLQLQLEGYLVDLDQLKNLANLYVLVLMGGLLLAVFLVVSSETGQILRLQRRKLKVQATHDSLTGLVNRVVIEDTLEAWCRQLVDPERQRTAATYKTNFPSQQHVAVLFIDLDGFKPVNDSLGLAVGDKLLQETAGRIERAVGEDCVVGRFGSDEFLVLVPKLSKEVTLTDMVGEILSAVAQPYHIDQYRLYLTASIGVTSTLQSPADAKQLIQHADMAMYQAKRQGRNHFHFYSADISDRFHESVTLRNQLQHVLEQGALTLYYQPIVRAHDHAVVGVEALLRWQREDGSFVPPSEFIPIAEDTGQIIPISSWVLHQACVDGIKLQKFGELSVAVNLSARQFSRANFIDSLSHTLNLTGFSSRLLHIELTESVLMEDTNRAFQQLQKLRDRHFVISLDDFGTGFSSLGYLKTLPVDILKIDRGFIQDVTENDDDAAITRSIITLAKQLNLKVIAEGVETPEQAKFVEDAGVHYIQGYYFARPMPLEQLLDFLAENKVSGSH